jgi:hypothetical protein
MKTWIKAVCDTHGEAIDFYVSNPTCTENYLSGFDTEIQEWIEFHIHCGLRLVGDDLQLDKLWDEGYSSNRINGIFYLKECEEIKSNLKKGDYVTVIGDYTNSNYGIVVERIYKNVVEAYYIDNYCICCVFNIKDIIEEDNYFTSIGRYSCNMTEEITTHTKYSVRDNKIEKR